MLLALLIVGAGRSCAVRLCFRRGRIGWRVAGPNVYTKRSSRFLPLNSLNLILLFCKEITIKFEKMLSKKQLKRERKRERDKEKERIAKEETQDLQQSLDGNTDADIDANIPSKKRKVSVADGDGDGGDGESPWKFEVDYNDHFETPKVAYADLLPVLQQVARDCKKPLAEVTTFLRL